MGGTGQPRQDSSSREKAGHGTKAIAPADSFSRRSFLGRLSGLTTAALASGLSGLHVGEARADCEIDPLAPGDRADEALQARKDSAQLEHDLPVPSHPCNGDEDLYSNKIGNFSKGLPHNALGEVDLPAYNALLAALASGDPADFEAIPMGSPTPMQDAQKLVNPQAGLAFELEGADSHHLAIPAAPAFSSAEEAGEIAENYWMALCRDIPFDLYGSNPLSQAAVASLSGFSDFRGPKQSGQVTTHTLFRGFTAGELIGPFISQFMWLPAPLGANFVEQRMRTPVPGVDFLIGHREWLNVQDGAVPSRTLSFQPNRRYIINGRDLGEWVHIDVLFQAYFTAALILLSPPGPAGGIGAPLSPGNPYLLSENQIGFGTMGGPDIATLVCEPATRALKAVWYQKWFVHRRLRPEEFAGRIHNHKRGRANYPIHSDILNSSVLNRIFNRFGSYLLPMAFPEGCPKHPAYGAGHATVAGACVTMLKALFDENHIIPSPVIPNLSDPTKLIPYVGPTLTVGNELNKLASNVAIGRDFAGVHWRTDYVESLKLGEQVTISILRDRKLTYNEDMDYSFTLFDGTPITI